MTSSGLPAPDPAAGEAAEKAANDARNAAKTQLGDGSLDLPTLFSDVDAEGEHHVLGHIHAKAALAALPNVSEAEAGKILDRLGIKHDEHLDRLGAKQREALAQAVSAA